MAVPSRRAATGAGLLACSVMLASCSNPASDAAPLINGRYQQPARFDDIYRNRSPEVVRYDRYTLVSTRPDDAQRDPLNQIIDITMPAQLVNSVGEGFRYLLLESGYSLCSATSSAFSELLSRPLPAVQRDIGPVKLSEALQVLAGPAWRLKVDEVNREICFELRDQFRSFAPPQTVPISRAPQAVNVNRPVVTQPVQPPVVTGKGNTVSRNPFTGDTISVNAPASPSASVNMVRKHADSKEFTGSVSASYGSWNKQRYVADIAGPLNSNGSLRGRVVTGYQDQDSWLDRYHKNKKFLYGVVDADLTEHTTLSLGYDYEKADTRDPTWGGLPVFYSNGSLTHYNRSLNSAADWTYYHTEVQKLYADLVHNFNNGWSIHVNGTHAKNTFSDKLLNIYSAFPDETTGEGVTGYGSLDRGKREQTSVDGYASGPFELFGRQHQLMAGVSYSRQHNQTYSQDGVTDLDEYDITSADMGAFNNNWTGNIAEPQWQGWYLNANDVIRQKSAYTAARFSLADPLSLIIGARYTEWSTNGSSGNMTKSNTTPYAGLVYDINDTWSAYASYTSIFQPQTYRDASGHYLSPVTGKSYETGLKSAWFDGRLTATVAVFRIQQENVGTAIDGVYVNNSSEQAYYATKGARSKGAEFELNGALTDNLQLTFGATRYVARDSDGRYNPDQPQTDFKLFTRYQVPRLPDLTIGGGINWQNRTFEDVSAPEGSTQRVYQGSYPLANLFARYQVTKQVAVQANVDNLFDREYYTYMNNYVYGEPRNFSVSVSYQF